MKAKYPEYKGLNLPNVAASVLEKWQKESIFQQSVAQRNGAPSFVFYEGPPSANGLPGIHHVMGRAIKDIFCRYQTLKGKQVHRKAGWDTHGLPVELGVEKELGITKEDIGTKISVDAYNEACKEAVMRYTDIWNQLTEKMGYWVDMQDPYITYSPKYMESVWWLLAQLYNKGLLYKGYTIQPYSPKAGTGLSSHELNQPGCYKDVKDTTIVAMFETLAGQSLPFAANFTQKTHLLAWTTTPWTLPSNTALTVGPQIEYALVATYNQYTYEPIQVILAKNLVAAEAGVPGLLVSDERGNLVPLVDLQGRFRPEVGPYAGMYVKNEYYDAGTEPERSVDVQIAIQLKEEGKAFKVEKYEHSYPHCWRTDKPVLYYPLDSWFIRVTDQKELLVSLNHEINWKPEATGTGRFGKWLENANDWNLSRSRYWGIPIPIWSTEEGDERLCIDSISTLKNEIDKSIAAGLMSENPFAAFDPTDFSKENYAIVDLHKHKVDPIILLSPSGKPMKREADLIDVWFDSGAMPYAQLHYPFENKALIDDNQAFPADFIAEGVDQTRGWFYTLHAIATMVFGSKAYKNVVSNGLVLDKNGQKMSKRLGNAIDPFTTLDQYGPDATRWYMITNAQPWDNLKFDLEGIAEVQRKFFGTLYNTYSFFALYANIDGFDFSEASIELSKRPEIDQWVISKLHTLVAEVDAAYASYEPTKAGRAIQDFVTEQLSNWYVRLCRRRFWKNDDAQDKLAAYQTLYTCLETVSLLAAPIAPFFMDQLYSDLNSVTGRGARASVHLADFPKPDANQMLPNLEIQMELAQQTCSLVLALRKKQHIRVRQPLQKIMIPVLNEQEAANFRHVTDLICTEVNVKELELLTDSGILVKSIKPNFKTIGPKYGKQMKAISALVQQFGQNEIAQIEQNQGWNGQIDGEAIALDLGDFEIQAQDIPGWLVANENGLTVALDVTITPELKAEGMAREVVNRIQNMRKECAFDVTDRITVKIDTTAAIQAAIKEHKAYICTEVLANDIIFEALSSPKTEEIEAEADTAIQLSK